MHLVIGGAYQGKLEYARKTYGLQEGEICFCTEERPPDSEARCLVHLERFVRFCVRQGLPCELRYRDDAVLLCDDIFCGIVPLSAEERLWREETGRLLGRLARESEDVTRIFCALPLKLK